MPGVQTLPKQEKIPALMGYGRGCTAPFLNEILLSHAEWLAKINLEKSMGTLISAVTVQC